MDSPTLSFLLICTILLTLGALTLTAWTFKVTIGSIQGALSDASRVSHDMTTALRDVSRDLSGAMTKVSLDAKDQHKTTAIALERIAESFAASDRQRWESILKHLDKVERTGGLRQGQWDAEMAIKNRQMDLQEKQIEIAEARQAAAQAERNARDALRGMTPGGQGVSVGRPG